MNTDYNRVVAGLLLLFTGINTIIAQTGLEFLNCPSSAISLCVNDPGARLPDNNQFYLGESDPNASSCSAHFTQQVELHSDCSKSFQYKIEVSYYDTSAYVEILSWLPGITDDQDEATLTFNTENATDNYTSINGLPYTSGCNRYHRMRWTVMDSCGNTAFCEKRIELYDCHAPIPSSNQGFKTLNFHSTYEMLVSLNDITGEYLDDCASSSQYLFSTRSDIYQQDTLFKFCEVPIGVLVLVPIWIADQGRDLNCNGIISWDERNKYQVTTPVVFVGDGSQDCSNHDLFISGKIKTVLGEGIAKTHVTVTDVNQSYAPVITDENGDYAFPHIDYAYPVTVTASRNDGVKNGVSTLDLVLIQKHLLGIEPFTRPQQFIAADASNSFSLSAIDLVILRKLILGLVDTFPIGKSWRFFDTLSFGNITESITIPSENQTANVDFIGVKLGDINLTADPHFTSGTSRSNLSTQSWAIDAMEYLPGDLIEIPVKSTARNSILGFQFTLSDPDLEFVGIKEGKANIMNDDYAVMKDRLTMSWFSVSPVEIKPGDILFTIKARAKTKGNLQQTFQLNSDITNAELYAANGETFIPKIQNKVLSISQSGPEFLNCPSSPVSLCVNDPGVRLPANNQIYSSEADSNATSCSVHVTQSIKVKSNCGHQLQYGVQLFLNDTSAAYTLQSLRTINTDSIQEAELIFNSELSPESFIQKTGIPYNPGCTPYHRIKWIVIDSCGNFNECEQLINLYDCQAPLIDSTPNFLTVITLTPGCSLHIYAKDVGFPILDDCTREDSFIVSLEEDIYKPSSYYDPCSVPYGVEVPFDIWAADGGQDVDCNGKIEWLERNRYKETVSLVFIDQSGGGCLECWDINFISGKIYTEDLQPVELVTVNLLSPGHVFPTFITNKNGEYYFNGLTVPLDFTITAERDDNHKNGVTTLDLLKIQKHLLGKEIINSPYDIIAADANNSNSVSAIDLIELRKLILGVYTKLPNNTSWRFVDKNYVFQDTLHPWPSTSPSEITGTATGNISDADFIGIKIGDLNNTVQANAQSLVTRKANKPVAFAIAPTKYEANEIINIDFSIEDLQSFNGFQFTLSNPDLEFLSVSSNLIDLAEDDYALFGDKMTVSWFDLEEIANHPGDIVFTVKAIAKSAGNLQQSLQLNSDITEAELYSADDEIFILKIITRINTEDPLTLLSPEPNPWSTTCTIPFHIKRDGNLTFTVYDVNGTKVFFEEKYYSAGYHDIQLNAGDVSADGLLFYTLQSKNESRSGKMILIK